MKPTHAGAMHLGEQGSHGLYGVLDGNDDGLLCHECGRRFTHLGLHAWRGHGMTANEYRIAHGLARSRRLVASATRSRQTRHRRGLRVVRSAVLSSHERDDTAILLAILRKPSNPGQKHEALS